MVNLVGSSWWGVYRLLYLYLYLCLYLYDRVTGHRYGQLGGTRQQGRGRSWVYGLILNLGNRSSRLSQTYLRTLPSLSLACCQLSKLNALKMQNSNAQPQWLSRYCRMCGKFGFVSAGNLNDTSILLIGPTPPEKHWNLAFLWHFWQTCFAFLAHFPPSDAKSDMAPENLHQITQITSYSDLQ